jgi:hypothetical protein
MNNLPVDNIQILKTEACILYNNLYDQFPKKYIYKPTFCQRPTEEELQKPVINRVRIEINTGKINYLQISRLVILDIDNNIIIPSHINASPAWPQTNKNIPNEGNREARSYPDIYHSAEGTETSGFYEFIIPPTIIKTIEIYNRTDCCSERIEDFTLYLFNTYNKLINTFPLTDLPIQVFDIPAHASREAERHRSREAEIHASREAERHRSREAERAEIEAERAEIQASREAERAEIQASREAERAEIQASRESEIQASREAERAEIQASREAERRASREVEIYGSRQAERYASIEAERYSSRQAEIYASRERERAEIQASRAAERAAQEQQTKIGLEQAQARNKINNIR